jgi:nitrate/nitrite transport system substrate-binding protein
LVIAKEKGLFKQQGLDVELVKEVSWANIRDKVAIGELDGAQMLATLPIASSLGIGGMTTAMVTAMTMDLNGNAITVSNALYERIRNLAAENLQQNPITASGIKTVIEANKKAGGERLRFAMVFPTSTHNYELRYWLASAGIDPDKDIELVVIPPPQMVENMADGHIDGFCVGEPWNSLAVKQGLGHTLITKYEIWNNSPEKVFGVTREWADSHPDTHKAVLKALYEAARWLDASEANRIEAAQILSREDYVNTDVDVLKMSMTGTFCYSHDETPVPMDDFNVFHRYKANFPWLSHAIWFMSQMIRWGHIAEPFDFKKVASEIYRPDIFREVMRELGETCPDSDYKSEGEHAAAWTLQESTQSLAMGADAFFDRLVFQSPESLFDYLDSLSIKHPAFALEKLK